MFSTIVQLVVVIICGAHLQTASAFGTASAIAITDDVLKGIASTPLSASSSDISFHGVAFGEIVP
jgi:hypothetical protein